MNICEYRYIRYIHNYILTMYTFTCIFISHQMYNCIKTVYNRKVFFSPNIYIPYSYYYINIIVDETRAGQSGTTKAGQAGRQAGRAAGNPPPMPLSGRQASQA